MHFVTTAAPFADYAPQDIHARKTRHVIETCEDKRDFFEALALLQHQLYSRHSPGCGFIKALVVRELHMSPEAQEEIECKIGQSLPRSGLNSYT